MTPGAKAADVGLGDDDLEMGAARHELEEVGEAKHLSHVHVNNSFFLPLGWLELTLLGQA